MLRFTLALLLLAALVSANSIARLKLRPNGRIVGGEVTTIEWNPWQVSLEAFGLHNCGGSIIAPDTIVTAAHCIDGVLSLFYQVVAGTTKLSAKDKVSISVKEAIVHEGYAGLSNDVAIIKLAENLTFSDKIQAVQLADEEIAAGTAVNVTGWGVVNEWWPLSADELHSVSVNIVDRKSCQAAYGDLEGAAVDDTMICGGVPEGGKDACQGDSGGPLTANGTLYGIVSWGMGCGVVGYPGVYTNVASVRSWIKENSGI